ncbi:HNH endonuclease [Pedobacter sp. AK013]
MTILCQRGAATYRNIQLLCEPCNRSKSDKIGN